MSYSEVKRYSIGIPTMFLFLLISSIVSIIGASLKLNAAIQSTNGYDATSNQPWLALRIVIASIFTVLFLLATILGFIEVGEPQNYKAKVLTKQFEARLQFSVENLETWELVLIMANYLLLPIGIAEALIYDSSGYIWMSFISIGIVLWSYNYRMGTRKAIKLVLPKEGEISLNSLSQIISRDQNRVKKSLMYLVTYENYPATYDFGTQIITYKGENSQEGQSSYRSPVEDTVVIETPKRNETKNVAKQILKPCPFCDTLPLDPRARFCHDCGASIIPAK